MSIIARSIASIGVTKSPFAISSAGYLAKENSGRSGVNRMLLMQLQEESLRQDELRKKAQAEKENPVSQPAEPVNKPVRQKAKKKPKKTTRVVEESRPTFTPLAPFTRLPEEPDFGAIAVKISLQVQALLANYSITAIQFKKQLLQESEDEEDLELLLLSI